MSSATPRIGLAQTGIAVPAYPDLLALVADAAAVAGQRVAFAEGQRRFARFDMLYNRVVEIDAGKAKVSAKVCGIAKGIDRHARLLIERDGCLTAYANGTVRDMQ